MNNKQRDVYSTLYDIVSTNKEASGGNFIFSKSQFLEEVGQPPAELKGLKGNIIYLILKICKNRNVQLMLQKMPKWILNIGRKFVG